LTCKLKSCLNDVAYIIKNDNFVFSDDSSFRANINSDEGIEDFADIDGILLQKKLVHENETDEENCLDDSMSNKSILSCSSRKSLTSKGSSSETEGDDVIDGTSASEDGLVKKAAI